MKQVSEMSRGELIEVVAAISLRIWGFIFVVSAFVYFTRWLVYFVPAERFGRELSKATRLDGDQVILHLALAFFLLKRAPNLAKFLCRGLESQLTGFTDPKK